METYENNRYAYPHVKKPMLPNALSALIFGIVSLCTMAFFGWIMGIIAINNAKRAIKMAADFPGRYSENSLKMANAGRTMGIIGLIFGLLGIIVWILYFVLIFALVSWTSQHSHYNYY
jgi:hypothetical protein